MHNRAAPRVTATPAPPVVDPTAPTPRVPPAATPTGAPAGYSGLARGSAASLVGAVVSAAANFLLVLVIARWTTAVQAGVFFGVTSLFLLLEALLRLGSDVGAVYFIARWQALGRLDRLRPAVRVVLAPVVVASVLVAIATLLWAPALADVVADGRGGSVTMLRLLAVVLPVAVLYDVGLGVTRGFGSMRTTVLAERVARPLLQLASGRLWPWPWDPWAASVRRGHCPT